MNRRELLLTTLAGLPAVARAAKLPRPAPALSFISHTGQKIDLAAYKGKVVVLEWLLTTCPHCQESSTLMSKLQSEYGGKGFQALGVAIDEGAGLRLPDYIKNYAKNFPVGVLHHNVASDFLQIPIMSRMLMPQIVLIDRSGVIQEQYAGDASWHKDAEKNIRAFVAKHSAAAPARRKK